VGMRKPEQALWDKLSGIMTGRWRADRVENKILQGMPDVYFGVSPQLHGWIELKVLPDFPKSAKTTVKVPHYTAWQANWHWTHRDFGTRSWIIVRVHDFAYVFPARQALALFEGLNGTEFRLSSVQVDLQKASDLDIIDALLRAR
jgi:hypothetical protein